MGLRCRNKYATADKRQIIKVSVTDVEVLHL